MVFYYRAVGLLPCVKHLNNFLTICIYVTNIIKKIKVYSLATCNNHKVVFIVNKNINITRDFIFTGGAYHYF